MQDNQKRRRHLCIVHTLRGTPNGREISVYKSHIFILYSRQKHIQKNTLGALPKVLDIYYCGRRTVKQVASGVLAAVMVPPCRWTISRAMARPSPAPPPRLRRAESRR